MKIPEGLKHILIDFTVVILLPLSGFFLYDYLRGGSDPDLVTEKPGEGLSEEGARLAMALRELNALRIDTSIFTSPAYLSLQDFTVPVPVELKGRPVPFIPVQAFQAVPTAPAKPAVAVKPNAALNKLINTP